MLDKAYAWLTFESLALHEVEIVALLEDAVLEAATQALQVPVVDIKHVTLHRVVLSRCVGGELRVSPMSTAAVM